MAFTTGAVGYAGALDHLGSFEYAGHGVASLFPLDAFAVECLPVSFGYGAGVGQEYVPSLVLAEDGGSDAALPATKYDEILHFI